MPRITRRNDCAPRTPDGHLYYARLITDKGICYKLGFTKGESVEKRLAYQGTGDENLIDEILLFTNRPQAYNEEQRLHMHFRDKRLFGEGRRADAPLFGNGQSELYAEDILGLDQVYTKAQSDRTRALTSGKSVRHIVWEDRFVKIVVNALAALLIPPVRICEWLFRLFVAKDSHSAQLEAETKEHLKRSERFTQDLLNELSIHKRNFEMEAALRRASQEARRPQ